MDEKPILGSDELDYKYSNEMMNYEFNTDVNQNKEDLKL